MEKSILIIPIIIMLGLLGCKEKEEPKPCNCGLIVNEGKAQIGVCTWVELENYCTKNRKVFCIDESDWLKANKGGNYCMGDTIRW